MICLKNSQETASAGTQIDMNLHHISESLTGQHQRFSHSGDQLEKVHQGILRLTELSRDQSLHINESGSAIEEMTASISSMTGIIREKMVSISNLIEKIPGRGPGGKQSQRGIWKKSASAWVL